MNHCATGIESSNASSITGNTVENCSSIGINGIGTISGNSVNNCTTDGIKCTDARGVTKQQTEGVIIGGLYDLGEWTAESDKTILIG